MRVCSFDIGIINLAFCKLENKIYNNISGDRYNIIDWRVIDLFNSTSNKGIEVKCTLCKNNASYYNNNDNNHYCKKHISSDDAIKIFTLKTCTISDLAYLIIKNLNEIDFSDCDQIILEQQPKLATDKMRNVSIIILNYFIMNYIIQKKGNIKDVKFINASHKLSVYDGPFIECKLKGQYSRNKFYAKEYCKYLIRNNSEAVKIYNNIKKKDDLSDCFLQGVWYIMSNNTISNTKSNNKSNNNIKININKNNKDDKDENDEDKKDDKVEDKKYNENDKNEDKEDKEDKKYENNKKKIVLSFKKSLTLNEIKETDTYKRILSQNSFNKYKNLKRSYKHNGGNYSLSNIKYLIDKNGLSIIDKDKKLKSSIEYFFMNIDNFKNLLKD